MRPVPTMRGYRYTRWDGSRDGCGSTLETGGRSFFPAKIEDLSGVYQQIADELASQYTIGYTSKNPRRDGAWRRIDARVTRQNATARTKRGYYAPTGR